jgi:peptidoglycan/LPS O-acetylase OafA/YrhL
VRNLFSIPLVGRGNQNNCLPRSIEEIRFFFVLSGFLITKILLQCRSYIVSETQTQGAILGRFYLRRLLRIFPLFYLILAIAFVFHIPPVRESINWHIFYFSNFYAAQLGDWPQRVGHFWTLAVEEQFYLLWPWLILFLPQKYIFKVIVALICLSPFFRIICVSIGLNEVACEVLTPGVIDTFGYGALLAYIQEPRTKINLPIKKITRFFLWCGLPLLLLIVIISQQIADGKYVYLVFDNTALGMISTWIISRASSGFSGIIGKFLELSPMVYFGKISYGIYVIHNFVPYTINRILDFFNLSSYSSNYKLMLISWIISTILLSIISWHIVEKPINSFKRFVPYVTKTASQKEHIYIKR